LRKQKRNKNSKSEIITDANDVEDLVDIIENSTFVEFVSGNSVIKGRFQDCTKPVGKAFEEI
jgi:hypothetical protein